MKHKIYNCPIEATLEFIGGKYKTIILWHLIDNILRYNELRKLIPQATPKMLTQQLRELEENGLIKRVIYPVVPPKVEYSLTEYGKTLIPMLNMMKQWGKECIEKNKVTSNCMNK